jgi:hypothetical protein
MARYAVQAASYILQKYRLPNCGRRSLFESTCAWAFDPVRRCAALVAPAASAVGENGSIEELN